MRTDKLREKLTTVELLGQEEHLVETAVEGLGSGGRSLMATRSNRVSMSSSQPIRRWTVSSCCEQESVLRAVATDGNAISSIEALAGSGKTTTAGAMREVFEAGGYRAFAAGPTGRAVRELARVGFERPRTLSAWEVKFEIMGAREAIRQAFGDPSKAVLLIDETGMADTRLLSKVATAMSRRGREGRADRRQLPAHLGSRRRYARCAVAAARGIPAVEGHAPDPCAGDRRARAASRPATRWPTSIQAGR